MALSNLASQAEIPGAQIVETVIRVDRGGSLERRRAAFAPSGFETISDELIRVSRGRFAAGSEGRRRAFSGKRTQIFRAKSWGGRRRSETLDSLAKLGARVAAQMSRPIWAQTRPLQAAGSIAPRGGKSGGGGQSGGCGLLALREERRRGPMGPSFVRNYFRGLFFSFCIRPRLRPSARKFYAGKGRSSRRSCIELLPSQSGSSRRSSP